MRAPRPPTARLRARALTSLSPLARAGAHRATPARSPSAAAAQHWSRLQPLLPGRSSHAIKNRYRAIHLRTIPAPAEVSGASSLPSGLGLGLGSMPIVPPAATAMPAASTPALGSTLEALAQASGAEHSSHFVDQLVNQMLFVDALPTKSAYRASLVELMLTQMRQVALDAPRTAAPAQSAPQLAADMPRWAETASSANPLLAQHLPSIPSVPETTPSALHMLHDLPQMDTPVGMSGFNSRAPDMLDLFGAQSFNPALGAASLAGLPSKAHAEVAGAPASVWKQPAALPSSAAPVSSAGGGDEAMLAMLAHRLYMQQQLRAGGVQSSHM